MAALRNGTRGGGVFKGGIADDIICKCWNEFSYVLDMDFKEKLRTLVADLKQWKDST